MKRLNEHRCVDLVRGYLELCQERKLEAAASHLAVGAEIVMPWGRFRTLQQLFSDTRQRYRWARKQYDTWDVFQSPDGCVVVVVTGTLFGESLQGVFFQGVRYIDRFVVRGEQIVLQQVWNDLADSGVLERKPSRLSGAR